MHNDNTPQSRRDDDAAATGITRRQWLQGALALTVAGLTGSLALRALADDPGTAPLDTFMTLSEALTGKKGLSRVLGQRYPELRMTQRDARRCTFEVARLHGGDADAIAATFHGLPDAAAG